MPAHWRLDKSAEFSVLVEDEHHEFDVVVEMRPDGTCEVSCRERAGDPGSEAPVQPTE